MLTLKQWRRVKDISQEKMAEQLGIHINTYQNWEKEPGNISVSNAAKIATILGVSPNDIIFSTEQVTSAAG
ncbi:MAG: helix-turn-helix transcriptional regulator [Lachnospiraceae bacterium]|nr:helix-turn-helix transcriptional regulator [Lachnospiraceae bacterium]